MTTANPKLVLVICHGNYHTPECYRPFITALKEQGIEAYCPQLTSSDLRMMSVGDISNPDFNREPLSNGHPQPADDAEVINELLKQFIV